MREPVGSRLFDEYRHAVERHERCERRVHGAQATGVRQFVREALQAERRARRAREETFRRWFDYFYPAESLPRVRPRDDAPRVSNGQTRSRDELRKAGLRSNQRAVELLAEMGPLECEPRGYPLRSYAGAVYAVCELPDADLPDGSYGERDCDLDVRLIDSWLFGRPWFQGESGQRRRFTINRRALEARERMRQQCRQRATAR